MKEVWETGPPVRRWWRHWGVSPVRVFCVTFSRMSAPAAVGDTRAIGETRFGRKFLWETRPNGRTLALCDTDPSRQVPHCCDTKEALRCLGNFRSQDRAGSTADRDLLVVIASLP